MTYTWLALPVLALTFGAAQAASLHVKFDDPIFSGVSTPTYDQVSLTFPNLSHTGSSSATVHAGRFQGTGSNVVGVDPGIFVDGLNDLYLYCYDLYQSVGHGWDVDYTINFNGETARTLDFLGAVNAVLNEGKAQWDPYAWLHPETGRQGAAIQLGIWESRFDSNSTWSMASGDFMATGLDTDTATHLGRFFAAMPNSAAIDGRYVMTLESSTRQDMITGDPPAQVPLPGTLALALPALLLLRRRS